MNSKSLLMLILRLGISAGLLIFLFATVDVDLEILWPDDAGAVSWLFAALACLIGSVVLASLRWQQVCRALGLRV